MNPTTTEHWQRVYTDKAPTAVSWYQEVPRLSLELIRAALGNKTRIIDVGGGASTVVDHLVDAPGVEMCVLDISERALAAAKARLGEKTQRVRWIAADATGPLSELPDASIDIWHDRAMLHFLTAPDAQAAYARNIARIVRPGGTAIIAGFAPDGPTKCSGLEVCRHDGASVLALLNRTGPNWQLKGEQRETHTTPWGATQLFAYTVLQRL